MSSIFPPEYDQGGENRRHEVCFGSIAERTVGESLSGVSFQPRDIFELKGIAKEQGILQHQGHDSEITKGTGTFPKTWPGQRKQGPLHSGAAQSQSGSDTAMRPAVAERGSPAVDSNGSIGSRRPELIRGAQTVLVRS
jgi:hypothetical protein